MNNTQKKSPQTTQKESEPISEAEIDENLEDSFPASDPPSWTLGSDHRAEPTKQKNDDDERAGGKND
jgi:hypothetical protein